MELAGTRAFHKHRRARTRSRATVRAILKAHRARAFRCQSIPIWSGACGLIARIPLESRAFEHRAHRRAVSSVAIADIHYGGRLTWAGPARSIGVRRRPRPSGGERADHRLASPARIEAQRIPRSAWIS